METTAAGLRRERVRYKRLRRGEQEWVVLQAVESGWTDRMACELAGISRTTLRRWRVRDGHFGWHVERARRSGVRRIAWALSQAAAMGRALAEATRSAGPAPGRFV